MGGGCIWKIASAPVPFLRFEMLDEIDTSNKDLRSQTRDEIDQRDWDRSLTIELFDGALAFNSW